MRRDDGPGPAPWAHFSDVITKPSLDAALHCVVGEPLRQIFRAVDMVVLGFGADVFPRPSMRPSLDTKSTEGTLATDQVAIPRIRIHVQCSFRLDSPSGLYVGGYDTHRASTPPHDVINLRDLPAPETYFDRACGDPQLRDLLEEGVLRVASVTADVGGGFTMALDGGWTIGVNPDSAVREEYWRLFFVNQPLTTPHFVVFPDDDE